MNRKEILEVRKQFREEKSTISRICCCYVNYDKEKLMENSGMFLTLPEDDMTKYFEIFKKTLSGTLGKNLLNMEFPMEQEAPGGTQDFLMQLLSCRLEDEIMVSEFFDRVIANYTWLEHYLIILIYASYDVPGKTRDNLEMLDASDTVYHHIMCSICPVNQDKAALAYNHSRNALENRSRAWVVDLPVNGFLFPAFNDRQTDIHNVLYYCQKPDGEYGLQPDFLERVLGSVPPRSAGNQKATFQDMVEEALGDNCDFDTMKTITSNLNEMVEAGKELPEPLEIGCRDVRNLLVNSGVPKENLEDFEDIYRDVDGQAGSLTAGNIADTRTFKVETPGIKITAKSECADLMEIRDIDGRPCLVIPVDDRVLVNGVTVRAMKDFRGRGADQAEAFAEGAIDAEEE